MKQLILLLSIFFAACQTNDVESENIPLELNFSIETAPNSPELFGEGTISTRDYARDFALSPDGKELFFTLASPRNRFTSIIRATKKGETWSDFEIASFSGKHSDLEPVFSPDGKQLFFASNRPLTKEGKGKKDYDIWKVEKVNGKWKNPTNLGETINTTANEFYPSLAANGNLYFTAQYADSKGTEDIYISTLSDTGYTKPQSLPEAINTATYEFNAFVSPDESYILFTSYGRKDDLGGGDLYISRKDEAGNWQEATHLGKGINSKYLDYCPFVSPDGKTLFFTSERTNIQSSYEEALDFEGFKRILNEPCNGTGNIYWVAFE